MLSCFYKSLMWSHYLHSFRKCWEIPSKGLGRYRGYKVCPLNDLQRFAEVVNTISGGELSAVEQGIGFAHFQGQRLPTVFSFQLLRRIDFVVYTHFTFTKEGQSEVCQSNALIRDVFRIHHWQYSFVIKIDEALHQSQSHPTIAVGKRLYFQEEHQFDNLVGDTLAYTTSIVAQQG